MQRKPRVLLTVLATAALLVSGCGQSDADSDALATTSVMTGPPSTLEQTPSRGDRTTESPSPTEALSSLDLMISALPSSERWNGPYTAVVRIADDDAPEVARVLGEFLEENDYRGDQLDLDVLADLGEFQSFADLPGLGIALATTGGLFSDYDELVTPDGNALFIGVYYPLEESDDQIERAFGFSPAEIDLEVDELVAISRAMGDDEFLLYFQF